jgi:hypothetical protein
MRDRIAAARLELESAPSADTASDVEDTGEEIDGDAESEA